MCRYMERQDGVYRWTEKGRSVQGRVPRGN
jgi:hypothetical protein